jgi:hypothetical protein
MKDYLSILILLIINLSSCSEATVDSDSKSSDTLTAKNIKISGLIQKGPFLSGTAITISELDNNLAKTGKTFGTEIVDNTGRFNIGVRLVSNYVSLRADGFYYNEILGKWSVSQISLYALADVVDENSINVNLISHLERSRIESLISKGFNFYDARFQAQSEVLEIFNIRKTNIESSEHLDISKDGDDNAILLAVSVILQGYRSEAELTQLLSSLSTDLGNDGVLDNKSLGSQLINHAVYLDTISIRNNLTDRYIQLKTEATIPHFEKYLKRFIDSTKFAITGSIFDYPVSGLYGDNILDINRTKYNISGRYSIAASLPKGTNLSIKITALANDGIWWLHYGSNTNWSKTLFDHNTYSQTFTAIESGTYCDYDMFFGAAGKYLIEYFENRILQPTRSKIIDVL